jgi:hypothetical protein
MFFGSIKNKLPGFHVNNITGLAANAEPTGKAPGTKTLKRKKLDVLLRFDRYEICL